MGEKKSPGASSSDAVLLDAVRGGEAEAFGVIYERHRTLARAQSRVLTVSAADAEDLVAETFLRILMATSRGGGPTGDAFPAYLVVSLRNVHIGQVRRQCEVAFPEVVVETLTYDLDVVEALVMRSEVEEAFSRLPESWRKALWATAKEGLRPSDLAGELGVSPNAASALVYRARRGLRRILSVPSR